MVALMHKTVYGTTISLDAELSDGALRIVGVDTGAAPQAAFGFGDYEYTTLVAAKNLPRVRELLAHELGDVSTKAGVLKLLQRAFQEGIFESDSDVRNWLERNGISSSFHTWQ